MSEAHVAIIDDQERMRDILGMVLERAGHRVSTYPAGQSFLDDLESGASFDVVVTDLKMPGMTGLEVLDAVRARDADLPVVVITAHGTVDAAMEAVRKGVYDFLTKPIDNAQLRALILRATERTALARENTRLRAEVEDARTRYDIDGLIAESEAMRRALDLAHRVAPSPSTVLVTGESGTGKERVARAVHAWSDRVSKPFIAVNCKALAPGVLESELFGHVKGAFTGATASRLGIFQRAHGGTVFLDEIGEVDGDFQAKLLRVLQEREVQPVGGSAPISVDVRVIAATNKDLRAEIDAGRFREDLFFRLAVIPIELAPLRERRADILPLARVFVNQCAARMGREVAGWSEGVEGHLMEHAWPGNVRELENAIERAVVLARGDVLQLEDLVLGRSSSAPTAQRSVPSPDDEDLQAFLDRMTREKIVQTLAHHDGAKALAAAALGVDRTTLYRMMKRLGVDD